MNSQPLAISTYRSKYVFRHPCFLDCITISCCLRRSSNLPKYDFVLQGEGERQELPKTDVKYCYQSGGCYGYTVDYPLQQGNQGTKLKTHNTTQKTLQYQHTCNHTGAAGLAHRLKLQCWKREVFRGLVDWVSRYEIKMILENQSKIVVFRHAICDFKVFSSEEQVGNQSATGNDQQTIHE